MVTNVQFEILNALSDDWEDLEQIFKLISLEYVAPPEASAPCWRKSKTPLRLAEIADELPVLRARGMVQVRLEDRETAVEVGDLSYVWNGWFALTASGR